MSAPAPVSRSLHPPGASPGLAALTAILLAALVASGCPSDEGGGGDAGPDLVADAADAGDFGDADVDAADADVTSDLTSDTVGDTSTDASPDASPAVAELIPCERDADCADEDVCTWDERCVEGYCAIRVIGCDDANECTTDYCDPVDGCTYDPAEGSCDDGFSCTVGDTCIEGVCIGVTAIECDDSNECTRDRCDLDTAACNFEPDNEGEACDEGNSCFVSTCQGGECLGVPVDCDDGNPCTDDSCDPSRGCLHTPNTDSCDDGSACTTGDVCSGGTCSGTAVSCDDGDPCTDDLCSPTGGCYTEFNTAPCDDGVACTGDGVCRRGECLMGASTCDDGDACTDDICDALTGECLELFNAAPCDDGDACTIDDRCQLGACISGAPRNCFDGRFCTVDTCDPGTGACGHTPSASVDNAIDDLPYGQYLGPFVLYDTEGDELCTGSISVSYSDAIDGLVRGSGRCVWDDAPLPDNDVIELAFTGITTFFDVDTIDLGTESCDFVTDLVGLDITFSGAIEGSLDEAFAFVVGAEGNTAWVVELFAFGFEDDSPFTVPPLNDPIEFFLDSAATFSDRQIPCVTDAGTQIVDPAACIERGGEPVPEELGECCPIGGGPCASIPEAFCDTSGGDLEYDGPEDGACCTPGVCTVLQEAQCEAAGGDFLVGRSCADGDADGFADACPAPPGCGLTLAGCSVDAGVLSIDVTGSPVLTIDGGFTPNGTENSWDATSDLTISTPLGPITIPAVNGTDITVTCGDQVSITGELGIPTLSGVSTWGDSNLEGTSPSFTLGLALGQALSEAAPTLADCGTYFYLTGTTRLTYNVGELPGVIVNSGSSTLLAIDPYDPAFYFEVAGALLGDASSGFLSKAGAGISTSGDFEWYSALPLAMGPGRARATQELTGHVFRTGKVGLLPILKTPIQLTLTSDMLVDLGPFADFAEAAVVMLANGDLEELGDALAEHLDAPTAEEFLEGISWGANATSLALSIPDASITLELGKGSVFYRDGVVAFAVEGFSDLAQFTGPLQSVADALSEYTVTSRGEVVGWVDESGFRVEASFDLEAGPLTLSDAQLTISWNETDGLDVDLGLPDIDFDFEGWLAELEEALDCAFTRGETDGCGFGGYEVGEIEVDTTDGIAITFVVNMPFDLGGVDFRAEVDDDTGDFSFFASVDIPFGPWSSRGATLILRDDGMRVIGTIEELDSSIVLDGQLWFDGRFELSGTGTMEMLLGFSKMKVTASLDNDGMYFEATYDFFERSAKLEGELTWDDSEGVQFELTGEAGLDFFDFVAMTSTITLTNIGTPGLFLDVVVDTPILTGNVDGEVTADGDYLLEGTGRLEVDGWTIAAGDLVIGRDEGVTIEGAVDVGDASMEFGGRVRSDGFALSGRNDLTLLGLTVRGDFGFAGDSTGAAGSFAGLVALGGSSIRVSGAADSAGDFSFEGAGTVDLFGFELADAEVTFDNEGLSISGKLDVGVANVAVSGEVDSRGDFVLAGDGAVDLPIPGGLTLRSTVQLEKRGSLVSVTGQGSARFAGVDIAGNLRLSSDGELSASGSAAGGWSGGPLSLSGDVRLAIDNEGFAASFAYRACIKLYNPAGPDLQECVTGSVGVDSNGGVCIEFPVKGRQCVDVI